MRLLFELDSKDYSACTHTFVRNSARSVIIRGRKIAMLRSLQDDCYEFPGGGIEADESPVDAMIRETREESGLLVIPSSVREYGYVHRIQKSDTDESECFVQDNFYYLCNAEENMDCPQPDDYARYTLEFVDPKIAIQKNRHVGKSPYSKIMLERETRVLELLIAEGYFESDS